MLGDDFKWINQKKIKIIVMEDLTTPKKSLKQLEKENKKSLQI